MAAGMRDTHTQLAINFPNSSFISIAEEEARDVEAARHSVMANLEFILTGRHRPRNNSIAPFIPDTLNRLHTALREAVVRALRTP
jgi:hypothetical protein